MCNVWLYLTRNLKPMLALNSLALNQIRPTKNVSGNILEKNGSIGRDFFFFFFFFREALPCKIPEHRYTV